VAHAEASARTVDAAVTAAAAQLGLRSDQVDVEVLEDPVPWTFGYIGTPARVRVTARPTSSGQAAPQPQIPSTMTNSPEVTEPSVSLVPGAGDATQAPVRPAAADAPGRSEPAAPPPPATTAGLDAENGQGPGAVAVPPEGRVETPSVDPPAPPSVGSPSNPGPPASATATHRGPNGEAATPSGDGGSGTETAVASPAGPVAPGSPVPASETGAPSDQGARRGPRPPRRTARDEPVEPQMVEEDTERAGDFLEGLLDALDVDGDITTWIDEVGGHIDLEGSDLDVLVGPNGETLDALQELTRLAVLRRSKRRVRLLIDVNGFRARQREQLISVVRATAEQVITNREDHEFQPMTPAERKIVHDAVAVIEGVRTESLGEEPNRRVVIRPD
jgi:spoIIIJ-associated protein